MAARHSGSDQSPPLGSSCGGRAWSRGLPVLRGDAEERLVGGPNWQCPAGTGAQSKRFPAGGTAHGCARGHPCGRRRLGVARIGSPGRPSSADGRCSRHGGSRRRVRLRVATRSARCARRTRPQNGALTLPERMPRSRPYMVQCASRWSQRPRGCPVNCWSTQGAVRPQSGWISVGQGRQSGQIAQNTSPSSAMRGLRRVDAAAEPGTATYFFSQPISSGAPMTP